MDEIQRCGNELHGIEYWLHHGDPRANLTLVAELTSMFQSVNQILLTSFVNNQQLAHAVKAEAGKSIAAVANRIASVRTVAAA